MSENERKELNIGLCLNGRYTPDSDMGWEQFGGEDREMTMWDVVLDMLLAARGKVSALASGDVRACQITWLSNHLLLEQTWKEMSQTLTEANFSSIQETLEALPLKWLADSVSSTCMLCNVRFHPIMCSRHHYCFCGGLYCNECSKGRNLLPPKFRKEVLERVLRIIPMERVEKISSPKDALYQMSKWTTYLELLGRLVRVLYSIPSFQDSIHCLIRTHLSTTFRILSFLMTGIAACS